jgi:septal ring factor EnvC (AmiA/AmiB activator)
LAQRPTLAQWQEVQQQVQDTRESLEAARRGRELAEAHHLVSQKQIEKLQQQVMALKTECVQAHAYAQTQEKEVALLQQRNQELEEQLATLRQSASASPQPAVVEPRSNHRAQERIPAAADESAPSPATTWRTPTPGIPPLTLDEREESAPLGWRQRTERLLKRSALAASRAGGETGSRNRIELPTFVQRRPY